MKIGSLVSSPVQLIPQKAEQLKKERVRISCLDILIVWWETRGHQGQKQSSQREGSRRSDLDRRRVHNLV